MSVECVFSLRSEFMPLHFFFKTNVHKQNIAYSVFSFANLCTIHNIDSQNNWMEPERRKINIIFFAPGTLTVNIFEFWRTFLKAKSNAQCA